MLAVFAWSLLVARKVVAVVSNSPKGRLENSRSELFQYPLECPQRPTTLGHVTGKRDFKRFTPGAHHVDSAPEVVDLDRLHAEQELAPQHASLDGCLLYLIHGCALARHEVADGFNGALAQDFRTLFLFWQWSLADSIHRSRDEEYARPSRHADSSAFGDCRWQRFARPDLQSCAVKEVARRCTQASFHHPGAASGDRLCSGEHIQTHGQIYYARAW